jgi:adenosine deaminase
MKSAFVHFDERLELINDVIKPGYAELEGPVTPRGDH